MLEYKQMNSILYSNQKPIAYLLDIDGFKSFLKDKENFTVIKESAIEKKNKIVDFVGCLSHYANPNLIESEKDAWKQAVKDKYVG